MSSITRPLVLVPTAAAVALGAALFVGTAPDASGVLARNDHHDMGMSAVAYGPHTAAQQALHDQMRKLWEDHVTWTRLAIVEFVDGSPGFPTTAARLLRNQVDIGDAVKPYFGDAAGARLTTLLQEHITIAVEVLQAAKAGHTADLADAKRRWYANADQIADFLSSANPDFWPDDAMRADMRTHLDQTLAEAVDELTGDYAAGVAEYEHVHAHILAMADMLSDGIIRAFPSRVR